MASHVRVVVCELGTGNVRSVVRAVEQAAPNASVVVSGEAAAVRSADVVVFPGQGAFGTFALAVESAGIGDALREHVLRERPYLGICLGMQVLFESSEEAPGARGLGVIPGHVRRLQAGVDPATGAPRALPHIGWNAVSGVHGQDARALLPTSATHFYFAHSYVAEPLDASYALATTDYGVPFTSAVAKNALLGVQFHPEKSQREGLALLTRFFRL